MITPAVPVAPAAQYVLDISEVLVLLFVTLGPPMKMPAVFSLLTRPLAEPAAKVLALKAFAFALTASLVGGFIGAKLMENWQVSPQALILAAGIVLFVVSLRVVVGQYHLHEEALAPPHEGPLQAPSPFQIAVPNIVTPYGMALIILLIASAHDARRTIAVAGIVLGVMLLNLVMMYFARPVMRSIGPIPLQLLSTITSVLTIGLSVQIILAGLRMLGLLEPAA